MGDSTRLTDLATTTLLERLSSSDPAPGGGSAAALAAAMGASLVAMVAALTSGRPAYAEHEAVVAELAARAIDARHRLVELAEEDAVGYAAVVQARRMPKETDSQREARTTAINAAMANAAAVPLRAALVAAEVLELAERIAPIGNRNAVSDAGVAAQLAAAGVRGAILNVRINLPYLAADEPLRASAPAEISRLEVIASERERAALLAVDARLEPA
jgi:methenyltetrahydrofolate cyclohydrolase